MKHLFLWVALLACCGVSATTQAPTQVLNSEHIRAKEAEACYRHYLTDPTNEVAILYLQTAIRRNPTDLRYLKELRAVAEKSGWDDELVQEYQSMLAYSLDEASVAVVPQLVKMVQEFRHALTSQLEASDKSGGKQNKDEMRYEQLQQELNGLDLPSSFGKGESSILTNRILVLREMLKNAFADDDLADELEKTETLQNFFQNRKEVLERIEFVEKSFGEIRCQMIHDENELKRVFDDVQAESSTRSFEHAKQGILRLQNLDLNKLPQNIRIKCEMEIVTLPEQIEDVFLKGEKMKLEALLSYVDNRTIGMTGKNYTQKLEVYENLGNVIAKYIRNIGGADFAEQALACQMKILQKARKAQKDRMRAYQEKAMVLFRDLISTMKSNEDQLPVSGQVEYRKNCAERILLKIMNVNREFLVPELNELYQDIYGRAMNDYSAWVEKENRYEEKALLLYKIATCETKWSLEEL